MTKLSQLLVIERDVKTSAGTKILDADRALKAPSLWEGMTRTYLPKDEDGDQLPAEGRRLQSTVKATLNGIIPEWKHMIDVIAARDDANTRARADVVVDGETVLSNVPSTHLLFLEKQLGDLHLIVSRLPVLDPEREWEWDDQQGAYRTKEPIKTNRQVKMVKHHVMAPATDKHPAQVEPYNADVVVGTWTQQFFSGAIKVTDRELMLGRVAKLQRAVKQAREQANLVETETHDHGNPLFNFVFHDML